MSFIIQHRQNLAVNIYFLWMNQILLKFSSSQPRVLLVLLKRIDHHCFNGIFHVSLLW